MVVAVATAAAAAWATWPLVLRIRDVLPAEDRDPLLNTWILAWTADRARHLFRGLWDAPILYPYRHTFAFSEHLLGLAPVAIPLEWLTRNPLVAYNVLFLASYVLAAVGTYLLVLELTGRRDAAIVAAAAFAFCPYRVAQFARLQIEMCGWIPVAAWGLHRYIRTRARVDLGVAVAAFVVQGLTNGYYLYYALVPLLFVAVWGWRTGQIDLAALVRAGAVSAAIGLVVFAPLLWVYMDVRREYDLRRDLSDNSRFSADVGSYLHTTPAIRASFAPARWLPDFTKPDGPLETKEGELFPGFAPLLLVIAAPFVFWHRRGSGDEIRSDARSPAETTSALLAIAWRRDIPIAAAVYVGVALMNGWNDAGVSLAIWVLLIRSVWPFPRSVVSVYGLIALWSLVLSLGPEPTAWGRMFFPGNPYAVLFRVVPGLDGLRVPARVGIMTSFAVAVIAGLVLAKIADRFGGNAAARRFILPAVTAAAVILVLADVAAPVTLVPIGPRGKLAADPLYQWLRKQPDGAVLELPVGRMDYNYSGFRYEYATLTHHHPIVNGWTGYSTPLQQFLGSGGSPLRDPDGFADALTFLRGLGVRYIVVHPRDFETPTLSSQLLDSLRRSRGVISEVVRAGEVVAFAFTEPSHDAPARSDCGHIVRPSRTTASLDSTSAPLAFDGDIASRWTTGAPQRGGEWFAVALANPAPVCGIEIDLAHSIADYPRRLQVDDAAGHTLFEGSVTEPYGWGFRRDAARPAIVLTWTPTSTDEIVLRQQGRSPAEFWSIDEMAVFTSGRAEQHGQGSMTNRDKK